MMAAALHPEAQEKVQEELDRVVGREKCNNVRSTLFHS